MDRATRGGTHEPMLRSDRAMYCGGAIFFNGAECCVVIDSFIDQVAGNAVFVNNDNRRVAIRGTQIAKTGASCVCFLCDPNTARSPLFHYDQVQDLEKNGSPHLGRRASSIQRTVSWRTG